MDSLVKEFPSYFFVAPLISDHFFHIFVHVIQKIMLFACVELRKYTVKGSKVQNLYEHAHVFETDVDVKGDSPVRVTSERFVDEAENITRVLFLTRDVSVSFLGKSFIQ